MDGRSLSPWAINVKQKQQISFLLFTLPEFKKKSFWCALCLLHYACSTVDKMIHLWLNKICSRINWQWESAGYISDLMRKKMPAIWLCAVTWPWGRRTAFIHVSTYLHYIYIVWGFFICVTWFDAVLRDKRDGEWLYSRGCCVTPWVTLAFLHSFIYYIFFPQRNGVSIELERDRHQEPVRRRAVW